MSHLTHASPTPRIINAIAGDAGVHQALAGTAVAVLVAAVRHGFFPAA